MFGFGKQKTIDVGGKLIVHADPITVNCKKVLAGLQLMGIPYDLKHVDYFKGEQKSAAYVGLNPMASLPSLTHDGLTLWESNAILQYAADLFGKSQFYPTDLKQRADQNRWLLWESSSWFPSTYVYLVQNCVSPLLGGQPDPAVIAKEDPNFHKLAAILDARLARSSWLCGNTPTIADIAVASPMHLHGWQKLPLAGHPNIKRWMTERVEQLPAWKNTMIYEGFTTKKAA
jgi:glutathione S-transferase